MSIFPPSPRTASLAVCALWLVAGCTENPAPASAEAPSPSAEPSAEAPSPEPKAAASTSDPSDESPDWIREYAEAMCAKMEECSKQALEKLPEAIREKAAAALPGKEECIVKAAEKRKEHGNVEPGDFSDEERAVLATCMDALSSADCKSMRKVADNECKQATELMQKKAQEAEASQ